jgi:hypothetical protein
VGHVLNALSITYKNCKFTTLLYKARHWPLHIGDVRFYLRCKNTVVLDVSTCRLELDTNDPEWLAVSIFQAEMTITVQSYIRVPLIHLHLTAKLYGVTFKRPANLIFIIILFFCKLHFHTIPLLASFSQEICTFRLFRQKLPTWRWRQQQPYNFGICFQTTECHIHLCVQNQETRSLIHYHVHKIPTMNHVLRQNNAAHISSLYFWDLN